MFWSIGAELTLEPQIPVHVHLLTMQPVNRTLLALKPITGNSREDYLTEAILPRKWLAIWNERNRSRSEVSPHQSTLRLDRIGFDPNLVFETCLGRSNVIVRLLDALSVLIEQPSVIV